MWLIIRLYPKESCSRSIWKYSSIMRIPSLISLVLSSVSETFSSDRAEWMCREINPTSSSEISAPVISRMISLPLRATLYSFSNNTLISGVNGFGICIFSSARFAARAIWSASGSRESWLTFSNTLSASSRILPVASRYTGLIPLTTFKADVCFFFVTSV